MVYEISYKSQRDAQIPHSNFTHSFFVENESHPPADKVRDAVARYCGGDFSPDTIEVEEHPEIDATEMKKHSPFVKLD